MPRIAHVSFRIEDWNGWERHYIPVEKAIRLGVRELEALCYYTFDPPEAPRVDISQVRWAVWPVRIWEGKALFCWRNLVTLNENGRYSLFGPYEGRIYLRPGESIELATPTLDGGWFLHVQLNSVESEPAPAKPKEIR